MRHATWLIIVLSAGCIDFPEDALKDFGTDRTDASSDGARDFILDGLDQDTSPDSRTTDGQLDSASSDQQVDAGADAVHDVAPIDQKVTPRDFSPDVTSIDQQIDTATVDQNIGTPDQGVDTPADQGIDTSPDQGPPPDQGIDTLPPDAASPCASWDTVWSANCTVVANVAESSCASRTLTCTAGVACTCKIGAVPNNNNCPSGITVQASCSFAKQAFNTGCCKP